MTTQQPIDTRPAKVQLTDEERRMVERFDDDQPRRGGAKKCGHGDHRADSYRSQCQPATSMNHSSSSSGSHSLQSSPSSGPCSTPSSYEAGRSRRRDA